MLSSAATGTGITTRIVVPWPGTLSMDMRPASSRTRSSRPSSPRPWRAAGVARNPTPSSETVSFTPADRAALSRVDGVERIEFMRVTSVAVAADSPRVALLARDIDPRNPSARLPLVGDSIVPRDALPAWISEPVADARSLVVGAPLTLPLAGKDVAFIVAGVWRDYARQQGAIVIERARYAALGPQVTCAGLAHSEAIARYLWDSGIVAAATDGIGLEAWPPDPAPDRRPFGLLHQTLIGHLGIAIGELWKLDVLHERCRSAQRSDFLIVSVPLNLPGATGSPSNAVAIL